VYLYENAATKPEWKNLANVRSGEYEALPQKANDPAWKPDFGPHVFNAKSGATAISAREFLIAYNINLNTRDKKKAHEIALTIRESGKAARSKDGKMLKDENGNKIMEPGLFTHCKAVGWYIDGYNRAQISINLTNYKVTPPHKVLDKVRELAGEMGIQVTGSELVGLIPKAALLESGKYYLSKMNESTGIPEKMIMETAIQSMGLAELAPFDLNRKVIEYAIQDSNRLSAMTVEGFCDLLSTDAPAPGGGSVAALCASMSGALSAMVSNLTIDKKGYEKVQNMALEYAPLGQSIKERAMHCIDVDTNAFYAMMDAMRLPKKTDEEIAYRDQQIEKCTQGAIIAPLESLRISLEAIQLADKVCQIGNVNALSDAGVAALVGLAAAKAAYFNIRINISGITDENFRKSTLAEAEELLDKCRTLSEKVEKDVSARL
ncbi:MAG: cyclodeaminase/cyclohydrolase family protein, partial [Candidatus Cloacimonetes bacterium]|nr:cyclodeaminase/cyclohydrolase family protein [Candidatus Cloacimonadota bacterium]